MSAQTALTRILDNHGMDWRIVGGEVEALSEWTGPNDTYGSFWEVVTLSTVKGWLGY